MKQPLYFLLCLLLFSPPFFAQTTQNSSLLYKEAAAVAGNGNYSEAVPLFQKVITLSPYFALGHYGLAKTYLHMEGKRQDAIHEFKLAIKLDKRLARAHFYLGMAHMFERQYAYAVNNFKAAYELDDTYLESLYNIGAIYDLMGHPNKSLLYYKKYLDEKIKEEEYFDY